MAGAYLGYVYLIIYFYNIYFRENKLLGLLRMLILTVVSGGLFLLIRYTVDSDNDNVWVKIFNWLGVIVNMFENLPLGFNIIYLIKNQISEKYTLFSAFFGFINECVWLSWAINGKFVNGDDLVHSIVANIFGIGLQISLFFIFFKFRKNEEEGSDNNTNLLNTHKLIKDSVAENDIIKNTTDNDLDTREESKEPDYIQELL